MVKSRMARRLPRFSAAPLNRPQPCSSNGTGAGRNRRHRHHAANAAGRVDRDFLDELAAHRVPDQADLVEAEAVDQRPDIGRDLLDGVGAALRFRRAVAAIGGEDIGEFIRRQRLAHGRHERLIAEPAVQNHDLVRAFAECVVAERHGVLPFLREFRASRGLGKAARPLPARWPVRAWKSNWTYTD